MRTLIIYSIFLLLALFQEAKASKNRTISSNEKPPIQITLNGKFGGRDSVFRFEDLKNNNKLVGISQGKKYKVTKFWCGFSQGIPYSPIFNTDSFSSEYLKFLASLPDGTVIMLHDVHFDSSEIKYDNFNLGHIVKDSSSLLIAKYGGYLKAESDIRVKIVGNPTSKDVATIEKIIQELNSCLSGIKAKRVTCCPSVIISFDTVSKDGNQSVKSKMAWNIIPFYPKLTSYNLEINSKIYNQQARDSILWSNLVECAFITWTYGIQNDLFIGKSLQNGLSYEGKKVIQTIYAHKNASKIREIWHRETEFPSVRLLILLFLSLLFFLILRELFSYYGFFRKLRYNVISQIILSLVLVQFVILFMYFFNVKWFEKFKVLDYEIFFCSFAGLIAIFFWLSDKITKSLKYKWLKLACNPLFTVISLYLAYQIIYLFIRPEVLRWATIDINAITISCSFIFLRFFIEYQSQKLTTLMQERELELTKHKELQNRAELNALQARINPHFLYNALNSIAELVHIDSKRTEKMVLSLSKLFQYNVNRESRVLTTLGEEIEMVKVYLEIEKQRLGDRLNFIIDVDNSVLNKEIPRFLIQPLVENAIKHGISKLQEKGEITLHCYEKKEKLVIEVYDNGPAFPEGINSGYGLQNTYEKLNIAYNKPYEIKFVNEPKKHLQIVL